MTRRTDGENGSTHQEAVIGQILFSVVSDCLLGVERFIKVPIQFIWWFWSHAFWVCFGNPKGKGICMKDNNAKAQIGCGYYKKESADSENFLSLDYI